MAKVVSFLNPKGGAGKTTLSINLARALALAGDKVLLVDSDPQGSVRDWNEAGGECGFPVVGIDRPTLEKDVPAQAGNYDWVVIDGAARLEKMAGSAVKASDMVIIPVQPSPLDIWACNDLVNSIQTRQQLTDGLPVAALQVSRAKVGTRLAREAADALSDFGLPVLHGNICDRIEYAETLVSGGTVLDKPGSDAAWEINHMMKQIKGAF